MPETVVFLSHMHAIPIIRAVYSYQRRTPFLSFRRNAKGGISFTRKTGNDIHTAVLRGLHTPF